MMKGTPAIQTVDFMPICAGVSSLRANLLCFEYVIQHRNFDRILRDINNNVHSDWRRANLRIICYDLMHNRLILRHIYKRTDLWKPLLSAQIKVLGYQPIRRMDDPVLLSILTSMKHWEAKHFVFAFRNGLSCLIRKYKYLLVDDFGYEKMGQGPDEGDEAK